MLSFRDYCIPVESYQRILLPELFVQVSDIPSAAKMKNKQELGLNFQRNYFTELEKLF